MRKIIITMVLGFIMMAPMAAHASTTLFEVQRNSTVCPFADRYILTENSWNITNQTDSPRTLRVRMKQDGKLLHYKIHLRPHTGQTVLIYVQTQGKILVTYQKNVVLFKRVNGVCF